MKHKSNIYNTSKVYKFKISSAMKTSFLKIVISIMIVVITVKVYNIQLNRIVTLNMLNTIKELAQHDKQSVETFINTRWDELNGIAVRFASSECRTILELETLMSLECSTGDFSHIYLLASDGKVYTDKYVMYDPDDESTERQIDFRPYFESGASRIVTRWDDKSEAAGFSREFVMYGIRINDLEVDGIRMVAIIGLSDTGTIQKKIILDNFVQNGRRRGYSAVVNIAGDYIISAQKTLYLNDNINLYKQLEAGDNSEMSNEEVSRRLQNSETFNFHYTDSDGVRKLLYFMPFEGDINWYFMMAVENSVFINRVQNFIVLSTVLVAIVVLVVIVLVLSLTASRYRTLQAVEKARSQGDFLSNMSHEIRTPLNGLIGLNHLVMTHIDDPEQTGRIREWLKKSQSTANYLLSLVNDVLDMSKLQAGKVDITCEPVLIEPIIDAIWSMQRDNIEGRGVHFVIERDISVPCVMGDQTRIKQVLMNIVGNAAKFTPKGGTITLSVNQEQIDDSHVNTIYRCSDTGIGMSKEFMSKIFDAFSQERNKNSDSIKGTGLGMAISKLLADAMGGDLSVDSELNVGTVFTLILPSQAVRDIPDYTAQIPDSSISSRNLSNDAANKHHAVKILVAEDNELNAEILLEILSAEGFETVHAENGECALNLFEASEHGEFDIILMDMQMPVMDGCTAALKIRDLDRPDAKTVTIFACTANTFQEDRDRAITSGMNDFLAKPIDVKVLMQKLNSI